jgi:hypothetical protein
MNIKTTIVLLLLIALCGGAWLAVTLYTPAPVASETRTVLDSQLRPETITHIEIARGDRKVVLDKGADGWSLPGKWPVRKPEVEQLVHVLSNLHSRFAPVPVSGDDEMKQLGLTGAGVLTVTVKAGGQDYKLTFGEEPGQMRRFSRPTYLRIDEMAEALRVAPGLIAVLDRPQEYYMQRRLFPIERIAKPGGERNDAVEQLAAKSVAVKGGADAYTVVRTGESWELKEPVRDRVDPDKIKTILTSVPDIWAEKFVEPGKKSLDDMGLKEPAQVLKVTQPQGDTITLLIGATSDKHMRLVQKPGASPFMPKPKVDFVEEEFRFAKLQDNDQVFEIKADKLKDIVVVANVLRDPQLARFKTSDVKKFTIHDAGQALAFVNEDGNWKLQAGSKYAFEVERSKVDDILDKLAGLRADGKDITDKADPKTTGLDKPVKLTVMVEEAKDKTPTDITFLLGKKEGGEKGKLYVQVAGWDRVNAVDADLLKLAQRPALAYRNRRVLKVGALDMARVDVERAGEKYALERASGAWRLALPVQADLDPGKAGDVPRELNQLEAVEFVTAEPKADDLDKHYGLAKPAATLKIEFSDKKQPQQVLAVGKKMEGKDEYYARLAGDNAVFTIKKDAYETLTRDSLSLRPVELWNLPADDIAEVRVRRGEEYSLQRDGTQWKLAGPFAATVKGTPVLSLTDALAHVKADKYVAHAASDLAAYGLDNPYLRVTVKPTSKKEKESDKDKDKDKNLKERVLLVGKAVEKDGKARYGRLGDGEAVFVLGEKTLAALDRDPLDLLDRTLIALPDVTTIRTTTGKETFTLTHGDKDWRVERSDGPAFTADAASANEAARVFSSLMAQKLVAYGDKLDLAKYGLDKPATTITVAASDKAADKAKIIERTLQIGGEVKDEKGAHYARMEGSPAVAVLDAADVADLQRSPLDFVNRTILKLDADKITALKRERGAETLDVVKKADHWQIVMPGTHAADDAILQTLVAELAQLRAKKIVAYPAKDVKQFGLDAPSAVVTVSVASGPDKTDARKLLIGKAVDEKGNGECYARVDGSDMVAILPARLAEHLLAAHVQFRDRLLAKVPAVGKLVQERGARKATFVNKDNAWTMTQPLEAGVEQAELQDLARSFGDLRAGKLETEKAGDLKTYGLDRPQVQWQIFAPDGAKPALTLLVGSKEKDGNRVYAKLESSDVIALLDERLSSQVLAEYRNRKVWLPLDAFQVEKVSYGYEKDAFVLQKAGSDWQVAGKPELKVKADAVRDTLDALSRLKAERWVVDKDADLKLFGLEPPVLTLGMQTGTDKRSLKVGRQEGGSNRHYAIVVGENNGAVFLLSEADARAIVRSLADFLKAKS